MSAAFDAARRERERNEIVRDLVTLHPDLGVLLDTALDKIERFAPEPHVRWAARCRETFGISPAHSQPGEQA